MARHQLDGKLAGIAVRAEHRAFLNGQEATLGYIGQMRIAPDYRGRWLVHQGAEWFREASTPDLLYFGVISSENSRVRQLMTGSRPPAGLHTRDMGGFDHLRAPFTPVTSPLRTWRGYIPRICGNTARDR